VVAYGLPCDLIAATPIKPGLPSFAMNSSTGESISPLPTHPTVGYAIDTVNGVEYSVRKTPLLSHLNAKHDHFTKTGSGQKWKTVEKEGDFCRWREESSSPPPPPAVAVAVAVAAPRAELCCGRPLCPKLRRALAADPCGPRLWW